PHFTIKDKICGKGPKETRYWLKLVDRQDDLELQERKTFRKRGDRTQEVQHSSSRLSFHNRS
ncbi:MAG: hypothetical protein DRQ24_12545, partial [Candidatus Latescibacterota bacterium]